MSRRVVLLRKTEHVPNWFVGWQFFKIGIWPFPVDEELGFSDGRAGDPAIRDGWPQPDNPMETIGSRRLGDEGQTSLFLFSAR